MRRAWNLPALPGDQERLKVAVQAAHRGDAAALRELRELVSMQDWERMGDLSEQVILGACHAAGGKSPLLVEATMRKATAIEQDLLGDDPGPIERLLVARVVACWAMAYGADLAFQTWLESKGTLSSGRFYLARQESAHRQLLTAIKALAAVRGLLPGAVQVNLTTGPQLNLAAGAADAG